MVVADPHAPVIQRLRQATADGDHAAVLASLEPVWVAAELAALWTASLGPSELRGRTFAERSCRMMLPTVAAHLRATAALGRSGIGHLPTAMAAGRSVFDAGLRVKWVLAPEDPMESDLRAAQLHQAAANKKATAADGLEKDRREEADHDREGREESGHGEGSERWRNARDVQQGLVDATLRRLGRESPLPRVPSVEQQLDLFGLRRLYHGFRLASEYVHGSLSSGAEALAITEERSPYGIYWPQDWYLAFSLSGWGSLFVADAFRIHPGDRGPVHELMWASDVVLHAPGHS